MPHQSISATYAVGHPFSEQAPNSIFHVWTYSAHQSRAHSVSAHLHVSSTVQTIVWYLLYSAAPQASPSIPAIAVGTLFPWACCRKFPQLCKQLSGTSCILRRRKLHLRFP